MALPAGIIPRIYATRRPRYSAPLSARLLAWTWRKVRRVRCGALHRLEAKLWNMATKRAPVGWCAENMGR